MMSLLFVTMILMASVQASLGGIGSGLADGLFKKYAMMKIFEDCYGEDVVRGWWAEMRNGAGKCGQQNHPPSDFFTSDEKADPDRLVKSHAQSQPKLEELLMAKPPGGNFLRTEDKMAQQNFHRQFSTHQRLDKTQANFLGLKDYPFGVPNSYPYQQFYDDGFNTNRMYGLTAQAIPVPFHYISPNQGSVVYGSQSGILLNTRQARRIDSSKADYLQEKIAAKIGNITCIMRELNFLDNDNLPNVDGIHARIMSLPLPDDIKQDMYDGLEMCNDFSKCVPTKKFDKIPALKNIARPYVFFDCFKVQKLMACIKKDVREKFGMNLDENAFGQRSGEASLLEAGDEQMFAMMFGFSGQDI